MSCIKCPDEKWKWGSRGKCIYDSKSECQRAGIAIIVDRINNLKGNLNKTLKENAKRGD